MINSSLPNGLNPNGPSVCSIMSVVGQSYRVVTMEKSVSSDLLEIIRMVLAVQLVMDVGMLQIGKFQLSDSSRILFDLVSESYLLSKFKPINLNFELEHGITFSLSHGEVWLGLDYWFWVQRSFGKSGAKLCNYIASGDTQRTYEYVCYEKFLISGAKDSFRIAKIGMRLIKVSD